MSQGKVLKILWPVGIILWSCLILLLGWEAYKNQDQLVFKMAKAEAMGSYNKDLIYRRWVAKQGGVYVPVTEHTQPNPYLKVPTRDITTTSGKQLTLINPAYMTRQVCEMGSDQYGAQGHITSLNPIRPKNTPDAWERECLDAFEKGAKESTEKLSIENKSYLRYMRYMVTEDMCLKCHAVQGYKVGDIRGGISVTIPMEHYQQAQTALFKVTVRQLTLLWIIGLLFFFYFRRIVLKQIAIVEEAQTKAELSEQQYRLIFDEMNIGFILADYATGRVIKCNSHLAEIADCRPQEAIGHTQTLFPSQAAQNTQDLSFASYLRHSTEKVMCTQVTTRNGKTKDIEIQGQLIIIDGTKLVLAMVKDVTQRKQLELQSLRLLRAIDQCPISVLLTDPCGRAIYLNRCFTERKGYTLDDCYDPHNPLLILVQTWIRNITTASTTCAQNTSWLEERLAQRKDSSTYWERTTFSTVLDQSGQITCYLVIGEDITAEKNNALQFTYQATHDMLTGLGNRLLLQDRVDEAIALTQRTNTSIFLMLLDIDRFKLVNDSLGHGAGDVMLQTLAQRIKETVRSFDSVVRLGGDEFAVLFTENTDSSTIKTIIKQLQDNIAKPIHIHDYPITVTASIGVCSYPDHGTTCDELIRYADIAMYNAKESGNCVCFYETKMDDIVVETMTLESELRNAIHCEQLMVYYQPKVKTQSGEICGFEALLRWNHPQRGMISPALFIPIAEQTGLIIDIGKWVIQTVCQQIMTWQHAGLHVDPVAVNLSAKQFQSLTLATDIKSTIDSCGISAQYLEFELTESVIMQDPYMTIKIMNELKDLGLKLALDDFGTGYSSLNYLRRFPLDYLKIDRSFIDDITQDSSADSVAESIISIAHNLGMHAIAEGVETTEQLEFLRQTNCDIIQGYYFYRPLPAADIEALLKPGETMACEQV